MMHKTRLLLLCCSLLLPSCAGMVAGAAVDTTVAVARVPFSIAGAALDLVVPGRDGDDEKSERDN